MRSWHGNLSPFGMWHTAGTLDLAALVRRILFSNNEPGFLTTISPEFCFADPAGTTPATIGGTVAYVADRSGNGNHWTQPTLASRPILGRKPVGGRRNLLVRTEEFDNAVWGKAGVSVAADTSTSPDAAATADTMTTIAGAGQHRIIGAATTVSSGLACVLSVYLKAGTHSFAQIHDGASASYFANFNLTTGVVGTATGCTATMTFVGDGWYRCSIAMTLNVANPILCVGLVTSNTAVRNESWVAAGTESILIWGAQLETNSVATPYQRVVTQFDVTEAGKDKLHYLYGGGAADPRWMITPTITPGTDKVQVFAGVRKLSDEAGGIVVELSATSSSNNGAFHIETRTTGGYLFRSRGTTSRDAAVPTGYDAPISSVLAGLGDISGDISTIRVDSIQAAQNTNDQGTGDYLAYPAYIGARGGSSLFFNGEIYSLIARFGPNLTTTEIERVEAYVASQVAEETI